MSAPRPNWTVEDDRRVIAEVNEMARQDVHAKHGVLLPEGTRCDMGNPRIVGGAGWHSVTILNHWRDACARYKKENGIDPQECLARHEAWLRSPENAPALYLDRR